MTESNIRNITIRELRTLAELEVAFRFEEEIWELPPKDMSYLIALAAAQSAAGTMFLGAFDHERLVGFAFAFPSIESRKLKFHSHLLAVHPSKRGLGLATQLKQVQRQRALALGITEMTWTFDSLKTPNAHLNFAKLGVICDKYKVDFYGERTSSPLDANGTDRLWVSWNLADKRVELRLKGHDCRPEMLETLRNIQTVLRCNVHGRPVETNSEQAILEQRIAIEIPSDVACLEREQMGLGRCWRFAMRRAFTNALKAGFVVTGFCRSIRGDERPGAYLLER